MTPSTLNKIMLDFTELTEEEYYSFWEQSPEKCFLSAPEMGKLYKKSKVFFLGVKRDSEIVASATVRGNKNRIGKFDFYAPGGPLIDYNNFELLDFFVQNLKNFLKKQGGFSLRINPNIKLIERDIDGIIVNGGGGLII